MRSPIIIFLISMILTPAANAVLTDDELLDVVQETTFSYFWDFAHPVSRLSREGLTHWSEI